MQIYGDTSCELRIECLARELLYKTQDLPDLASLRATLIGCGQLEQLVWDSENVPEALRRCASEATDHAAAAWYATWSPHQPRAPRVSWSVERELGSLRLLLNQLGAAGAATGVLKTPEGFAFYALYPEQYAAAAIAHMNGHRQARGVRHVLGLRSIGTTLSAAVAVVLRAAQIDFRRCTVRPHGHPFDRQLELQTSFDECDLALVVDEGPGLSGSSFFSVARALDGLGVASSRQAYFCAHAAGPGSMATEQTREFWRLAERHTAACGECAISAAGSLTDTLRVELSRQFDQPVVGLEDISAGRWREHACARARSWPAAYPQFERPKILAHLEDGQRLLLKFYGQVLRRDPLSCDLQWSDVAAAQQIATGCSRVTRIHGYVARAWLEGERLTSDDKSPALLEALAIFLGRRGWQRLTNDPVAVNAWYGASGPLGPGEWLKLASGSLHKLPETLTGYDHTAIAAEPLGWDLAAAVLEWQLTEHESERLLALFRRCSGIEVARGELSPYLARYARFHAAKATFCAQQASGDEAERLLADARRYAAKLEELEP